VQLIGLCVALPFAVAFLFPAYCIREARRDM
jgi:hypothetical protein